MSAGTSGLGGSLTAGSGSGSGTALTAAADRRAAAAAARAGLANVDFRRLCSSACCRRSLAAACSRTIAAAIVAADAMLPRLPLCRAAASLAASFEASLATCSASPTAATVRRSTSSASFALRAARLARAAASSSSLLLASSPLHLSSPSGEPGELEGRCCA